MFWPTRLTYSVMTGSSTSLAWRSISAESWRPIAISFSVDMLILAKRPPLSLRLPMKAGFSSVERGLPAFLRALGSASALRRASPSPTPLFSLSFFSSFVSALAVC
jgi:hypothetical protein